MRKTTPKTRNDRDIHGILLLDKGLEQSSNDALQRAKRLYRAKKAGHTGSLDRAASGLLPVCFGEATKVCQFLLDADKSYQVTAKLGVRTTTSDSEGEVVASKTVPDLTMQQLDRAFDAFRGEIDQVPSMYSALKYQGTPLYKYARQGITIPRDSRRLHIYSLQITRFEGDEVDFIVSCSKGTYVRTLVDDFGEALGCGAHVSALRRLTVGPFCDGTMYTLEQLAERQEQQGSLEGLLLPIESALMHMPAVTLSPSLSFYLQRGQAIMMPELPDCQYVRLRTQQGQFFGIGEVRDDNKIAPKRLLNCESSAEAKAS